MTLVEVVIAVGVLVVGLLGFMRAILYAMNLARAQREVAVVSEAGRQAMESLRAANFNQVFKLYNANPNDDPGGAGTGPGANIALTGFRTLPGDNDGSIGRIIFPIRSAGGLEELRENIPDTDLGTPRDLNGDGAVDTLDHANDYRILPVVVRFDWQSANGPRHLELKSLIADY